MTTPSQDLRTDPSTTVGALGSLVADVAAVIDAVDDDTWRAVSPCPDMPVDHLVEHLTGGLTGFTHVAHREEGRTFDRPTIERADAARSYRDAGEAATAAWSAPGRLDEMFPTAWGETVGSRLVGFLVLEQAVHGWDLARALGRPADFDARAVAVADSVARAMVTPQMRVPGMFGPEVDVPSKASRLDRLAAFLGRRP